MEFEGVNMEGVLLDSERRQNPPEPHPCQDKPHVRTKNQELMLSCDLQVRHLTDTTRSYLNMFLIAAGATTSDVVLSSRDLKPIHLDTHADKKK